MKRTKQAAAALTALALAASMALPVWAADGTEVDGKTVITDTTSNKQATCDVKATYSPAEVIHVDIKWDDMTFEFVPGEWTPEYTNSKDGNEKATYKGADAGWNNETAQSTITVTNKSNANLKVTFDYNSDSSYSNVLGDFYTKGADDKWNFPIDKNTGIWMQSADANINGITIDKSGTGQNQSIDKTVVGQATEAEVKLVLTGRPQKRIDTSSTIGTVTVTVASVDYNTAPDDTTIEYSKVYKQPTT